MQDNIVDHCTLPMALIPMNSPVVWFKSMIESTHQIHDGTI
jgi:hypothetical protein